MGAGDVTIVIPVSGDLEHWRPLARRAEASALAQTVPAARVVVSEAPTLADARNRPGLASATDGLVFLDADDTLDPGYVEAMLAGLGDVRQPATLGVVDGVEDRAPVVIAPRPLLDANYIVIGAFVRTALFAEVGGFRDLPAFEDWDLWVRCWLAGAEITCVPGAVYHVHVNPAGRNSLTHQQLAAAYHQVRSRYIGQQPRERARR